MALFKLFIFRCCLMRYYFAYSIKRKMSWRFTKKFLTAVGIAVGLMIANVFLVQWIKVQQIHIKYRDFTGGGTGSGRLPSEYYNNGMATKSEDGSMAVSSVNDIIHGLWSYNETAAKEAKKEMEQYFNPYKVITMTTDDVAHGQLARFYKAKSMDINIVPPGLRRLLPTKQLFKNEKFRTCSVVGNSGILLNSSCGRDIDSANFIIRCNFATILGYEKDVGVRTNMITFNPSILDKRFRRLATRAERNKFQHNLQSYGDYVLWVPIFSREYVTATIRTLIDYLDRYAEKFKNVQLAFPGNILEEISQFWYSKGVDEERISTGLLMYNVASAMCEEIHLYGFYPFSDYNGKPLAYHYDDPPNRTQKHYDWGFKRFHRLPDEFVYLKQLHKSGAIKLHIGQC